MSERIEEEERIPQDIPDPQPPMTNPANAFFSAPAQALSAQQDNSALAQCLRFCLPIRNFIFAIYGIFITLFIVIAIIITVVFIRQTNKFDEDFKDIKEKTFNNFRPSGEGSDNLVVVREVSVDRKVEKKVTRIGMIVNKLRQLNLKFDEDIDINNLKPHPKEYTAILKVSDSSSIKLSEIVAIVEMVEELEDNFDPEVEAQMISTFKKFIGKYGKKYKNVGHFLERYGYFRVNYKEIEAHNKGI